MKLDNSWIGRTVSSATLMEENLIPVFERILTSAGVKFTRPPSVNRMFDPDVTMNEIGWERVSWYLEELFDKMNDIAPDSCYFGAHEGDGALFGFWPIGDEDPSIYGGLSDE